MRERRAVLRNLLLAWSPFDKCDYRVQIRGGSAVAYAWNSLNPALADAPVDKVWPESMWRQVWAGDGLRLAECLEGYELQSWKQGVLMASRWFPEPVGATQIAEFLRSVGGDQAQPESGLPSLGASDGWLSGPWADAQGLHGLASNWSRAERLAVGVSAIGLAALTGAQAHQLWASYEERESAQAELERVQLASGPVLAARDRALAQARSLDALTEKLSAPQPLEVMQHLARLLPSKGVLLKDFELLGDKLRLGLELSPEIQRSALVKELQSGGWFVDVAEQREVPGRNWVSFEMRLKSVAPPLVTEAAGAKRP